MAHTALVIVDPPPLLRQRTGSLLAAANTPPGALVRMDKTGYRGTACTGYELDDACSGVAVTDHGFDSAGYGGQIDGTPLNLRTAESCSAMGTREGRAQRALDRLELVTSYAVAKEFWTGERATAASIAGNEKLAGAGSTDLHSGGAVSPVAALGFLEQFLADTLLGAPGVIHCTVRTLAHFQNGGNLRVEGDLILTARGTRVIADAGYPGTSPAGAAAATDTAWAYASARPTVLLSAPSLIPDGGEAEAVDNTLNTIRYEAERGFLTLLECAVAGVRVTLATS